MSNDLLTVREMKQDDIEAITNYWLSADNKYMEAMGVDIAKIPAREEWAAMLMEQLSHPVHEKKSYCIIWEINGAAVGHSNINKIQFAKEAYMHLHLWKKDIRAKGNGTAFVKMTLPYYFENYQLKYCIANLML
ncbi:GNAT family N-acetyltransferase [Panacibacter ginsenosidivorans]|uniref:GNAT family N-acetyltransferase n=1 Tax=Panacibacter ginsenosidivorans TaxID=1813871 RepID=A0A5B8V503_9BACT|nr:GNAT family protein [Panacibacter ginsenosidivorans]QEC66125.1 GNAT family N-acetyltransferase [Panacibacter ginsenosidivorans]